MGVSVADPALFDSISTGSSGSKEDGSPDDDAAAAETDEDGAEGSNADPEAAEGAAEPSDDSQEGTGGDGDADAELQPDEEPAEEPVMNSMLVVDDTGRSFMEDANGNHIRVILDAEVTF